MGFITGGPNEAIVVSGVFHSKPLIVVGGWAFVIPCIQKVQRLSLNIMTLKVSSPTVYTMQGVPLSVTGIAQVIATHCGSLFSSKGPKGLWHPSGAGTKSEHLLSGFIAWCF